MHPLYLRYIIVLASLILASCANTAPTIKAAEPLTIAFADDIQPALSEDLDVSSEYVYRLSIGDKLDIRFFRRPEYNTQVIVAPDGNISLPFLPSVKAEGKTLTELTYQLQRNYLNLSKISPRPQDKKYLISVGDKLEIKFPYVSQYSGVVRVPPDGRISLPLIGSIVAEGLEPERLQQQLIQRYEEHFENPVLVVSIVEAVSNFVMSKGRLRRVAIPELNNLFVSLHSSIDLKVYVGGEVKNPSSVRYEPTLSTLQAIIAAGGITNKSELNNVVILRKGFDNKPRYIVRDLEPDISGESTEADSNIAVTNDITLRPFDIVIVPKTKIAKVSDALNAYLFDLLPMLRNSSIGFNYQIGTSKVEQTTTIIEQN